MTKIPQAIFQYERPTFPFKAHTSYKRQFVHQFPWPLASSGSERPQHICSPSELHISLSCHPRGPWVNLATRHRAVYNIILLLSRITPSPSTWLRLLPFSNPTHHLLLANISPGHHGTYWQSKDSVSGDQWRSHHLKVGEQGVRRKWIRQTGTGGIERRWVM